MPRRQDRFGYGTSIPPTTARVSWAQVGVLDLEVRNTLAFYGVKKPRPSFF